MYNLRLGDWMVPHCSVHGWGEEDGLAVAAQQEAHVTTAERGAYLQRPLWYREGQHVKTYTNQIWFIFDRFRHLSWEKFLIVRFRLFIYWI